MSAAAAGLVALLVVALAGLLWARRDDARARWALPCKATASAAFVAIALVASPRDEGPRPARVDGPAMPSAGDGEREPGRSGGYALAVRLALVASLLGDLALVGSTRRHVAAGMGLFLLAHVGFAVAFGQRIAARHDLAQAWPLLLACAVPAFTGSGLTVRWSWAGMGPLRPAGVVYGVAVAATAALALALALLDPGAEGAFIVGAGGVLFFLSDIAVARQRFVKDAWVNRALGLPAYYAGQVLLALSVGRVHG